MILGNVKEEQKKLLSLIKRFDSFCKEHDIKYFLFAGTELGAVREHGFIPWDGDIDLMMSYPEYEKLLDAAKNEKTPGFRLAYYETDKNIPSFYAKVFDPNVDASHLEDFAYIEIYPFGGIPDNELKAELLRWINYRNSQIYWVKKRIYRNDLSRKHNQIGLILKILLFWLPGALCRAIFRKSTDQKRYKGAKMGTPIAFIYNCKRTAIPLSWLDDDAVYMPFEDTYLPVISAYKEHLIKMYGEDYMTPKMYDRYKKNDTQKE